jgi:hypothetical protein
MQLAMVTTAERYGEFVTDFETKGSGLGKAQVMRIRRLTTAHRLLAIRASLSQWLQLRSGPLLLAKTNPTCR